VVATENFSGGVENATEKNSAQKFRGEKFSEAYQRFSIGEVLVHSNQAKTPLVFHDLVFHGLGFHDLGFHDLVFPQPCFPRRYLRNFDSTLLLILIARHFVSTVPKQRLSNYSSITFRYAIPKHYTDFRSDQLV
jgi:hypothetical protein